MMWTSYEALCEMGTAAINSNNNHTYNSNYNRNNSSFKPELDPTNIFGVIPSNLYNIPKSQGGYGPEHTNHDTTINMNTNNDNDPTHHNYPQQQHQHQQHHPTTENQEFLQRIREVGGESQSPFHIVNASPIMTTTEEEGIGVVGTDFHPTNHSLHHHTSSSSFVPQTPYARNNKIHHVDSAIHATSLFPQSAMSTNVGGGGITGTGVVGNSTVGTVENGRNTSSHLPPTTLFTTPGLTPIPYNPTSVSSTTSQQQQLYPSSLLYSYTKNEQVFSRAKQVASRLYYEPSPELTPPPYFNNHHQRNNTSSTVKSKIRLTDEFTSASTTTTNNNATPTSPRYSTNATTAANLSSALKMSRRKQYKRRTDYSLLAVEESKQENEKTRQQHQQRLLFDGVVNSTKNAEGNSDEDMIEEVIDEEEVVDLSDEVEKIEEESKHRQSGGDDDDDIDQDNGIGEEGIQHILDLFCTLGAAQRMLCSYRCKEALQIYRSLPNSQYNTGFVQHQVGRAFFEISDYSNSQHALETMQRVEPYR